jgi:hypothetical protein
MESWLNYKSFMRTQLIKDNIETIFSQKLNELTATTSLTATSLLELIIEFFKNYQITDVDTMIPDNDMLLFEYGTYDWHDGKGKNFTFAITRQFYVENEMSDGFSQFRVVLYFNSEEFKQIKALNKWSIDFENIDDWKIYVSNTDGFKRAEDRIPKSFEVFLTETD